VAKRANYGFVKRQKELKRQERKEEKAEKKRLREAAGSDENAAVEPVDEGAGPEEPSP
jgi:hypothetical protein